MGEKETRHREAGTEIDFRALELEIDREIDSQFVPMAQRADGAKTVAVAHDAPRHEPKSEKSKSSAEPGADLDLGTLQAEIDKEIDSQFVPMAQRADGAKTVAVAHDAPRHEPKSEKSKSQAEPGADLDLGALQAEIDKEIDSQFVPMAQRVDGAKTVAVAHDAPRHEPKSEKGKTQAEPGTDLDLGALQAEIDKEIDSQFVPLAQRAGRAKTVAVAHDTLRHEPKSEKNKTQAEPGADLDFGALQAEIDKEIDSQFVPLAQRAGRAKTAAVAHDTLRHEPKSEKNKTQAEPGADLDFGALQAEIDKEIDCLFVPAGKSKQNQEFVQTGNQEQHQNMQGVAPGSDAQSRPVARNSDSPSPKPFETTTSPEKYVETPPDDTFDSKKYHRHELSRLIETFNAAYLSLDWELSRKNIEKLLAAIRQLEPFASRSPDARSVLKITDAILKRLVDRPHAVNSKLIGLIRDSQGLLAHLLLMEDETGPHEKQRIEDIIQRFQDLRRRALAVKGETKRPKAEEILPEAMPPAQSDKLQAPREVPPASILSTKPQGPIEETRNLIEKIYGSLSKNLEIIDTELARLRQIEKALRRTPALVHIAGRLNEIANALKDQADILRFSRGEMKALRPKSAELVDETAAGCENTGLAHAPTPVRREDLFLIASYGKWFALPACCVIRVARSPGKKALKILERGYATLADFTPVFRWFKSGVLGEWTKLPARELKSYRFEPLESHSPDMVDPCGPMAVLASDGQTHRIIFGEIVNFISDVEIDIGPPTEASLGPFESKSHIRMPVFDPNRPFSIPDQPSNEESKTDECCGR